MFFGGHKVAKILYIGLPIVTMVKPYSYHVERPSYITNPYNTNPI